MKRFLSAVLYIVTAILVFCVALIGFSSRWAFTTWGDIDMDEIIFHLQNPLEGTGGGMIGSFLLKGLLPAVLVTAVFVILLLLILKGKARIICSLVFLAGVIVGALITRSMIWERLNLGEWIEARINRTSFIEDHYADPGEVKLTFPEQKKNLIFIYLESMETTYADSTSGGAFPENTIPELTQLAVEGEDFSGAEEVLNGAYVMPGTAFTTGAIFAQTAGLPLKVSISGNFMDTRESFFPQVTALGDILEDEGYRQIFLLGSDATFGGRRLYYQDHGNVEMRDYLYAKENGWIEPDYEVFWGYEDEKLFSFARDTLTEIAGEDQPFALTILTVDTHYEDGYVCRLCQDDFPGNQYANVMACSSRQTAAFLDWLKDQDFYKDTAVVISGDHTTMDTDFCNDVDSSYPRRTYTAFLNADTASTFSKEAREYSTFDIFPTTLAAMGVDISGNRLGLGVNLFSEETTLTEEYGVEGLRKELSRGSDFLEELEKADASNSEALYERLKEVFADSIVIDEYNEKKGTLSVHVSSLLFYEGLADESLEFDPKKLEIEYQEDGSSEYDVIRLKRSKDMEATYEGTIDLSSWSNASGQLRLNIYTKDGNVYKNVDSKEVP